MKVERLNLIERFKRPSLNILVLAALGCLIYLNSLGGGFVWDDSGLIAGNKECLENFSSVPSVFFKPTFEAPYYRPLLWVSFSLDYFLWGQRPIGFHITNVAVHIINIWLVYWFVVNLGLSGIVAFFTAGLFAAHPVQTESISWISGRNDSLMVLFVLFFFNLQLLARKIKKVQFKIICYSSAAAAFACAVLTKESAVIALPLLILIDIFFQTKAWKTPLHRETLAEYTSLVLVIGCLLLLRSHAISNLPSQFSFNFGKLFNALTTPLTIYTYYCKVLLFPFNLTVAPSLYSRPPGSMILMLLIVCSIALASMLKTNIRKEVLFGILWIMVYLLPVSGFVWMSVPILEHRLYGASIGFCFMLAVVCYNGCAMLKTHAKGVLSCVILVALLILYSYLTIDRNRTWNDEATIWSDTLKKTPNSVMALNNLANALIQQKKIDQGIAYLHTGLKLNPRAEKLYGNLGRAFFYKKDYAQAIKAYEMALSINPRSAETYNHIALAYKFNGNNEAALANFNKSLALKPRFLSVYLNRGDLYRECGDKIRALADYQRALQLSPHSSAVHNALGFFYEQQDEPEKALTHYQLAIAVEPGNYQTLNNISQLYSRQGDYEKALTYQAKALTIKPDAPELHLNLGLLYFNLGKLNQAIEAYRRALSINPAYIEAHFNIATAYLLTPEGKDKAIEHFNRVLTLKPDYIHSNLIKKVLSSLDPQEATK